MMETRTLREMAVTQQAIRDKCFHPTGAFVAFTNEEIEQSIAQRFERMVELFSDRLAVSDRRYALTYDQLNQAANQLAHAIVNLRGSESEPIGLLFSKSSNLIIAILAALKANKPYVLLDSSLPDQNLKFILQHSQITVLATDSEHFLLAKSLTEEAQRCLNLDELGSANSVENLRLPVSPDALAWIHYTSGSTNQPKGVTQNQRNALHVVMTHTNNYHICSDDRLSFLDSRGGSVLVALLNGAAVVPFDIKSEGVARLGEWLVKEGISIYGSVVSTFRYFTSGLSGTEDFSKLRLIRLFGEPVYKSDVELYRKFFPERCILENRLASNESPTICQYFMDHTANLKDGLIPVGYVTEGNEISLVDDASNPVGVNQVGEIVVKSRFLALGYWRQDDLSTSAFLPVAEEKDERIYRTGDLARYLSDGCLVHVGRKDFQVKIRGNRVELSEIETALLEFPKIREVVVRAIKDATENTKLVAYLVPEKDSFPSVDQLRSYLAKKLPDYMIPSVFMIMENFPKTGIGKIDLRALPEPRHYRPNLRVPLVNPRSDVEISLAKIWNEVLFLDEIGVHDNFFDLGGHSLAASRVVSRVIQSFQVVTPLKELFDCPTIAQMARVIRKDLIKKAEQSQLERMLGAVEAISDAQAEKLLAE